MRLKQMKSWFVAFAVLTLVLSAVPAAADEHEFVGAAEGTALKLTITPPGDEPQGLTFGLSSVVVQSSPSEECEG
ncbi:MAG TPA: hypothetical protein VM307_11075, partial [Egibacteraceae bacterium]|nr:hypothetical protein [Egibacteraceae bacterium]